MWSVDHQSHQTTTNKTRNRNRHNPREKQESDSLPVNSLIRAIAQPNTNSSTSNTHTRTNGQLILTEDQNRNRSTHLHTGASARRVVGDLITHDLHDVVAVGDEAETDGQGNDGDLPERDVSLGRDGLAGLPCAVHAGPDADGVADVIGAVGEGRGAGGDDLDEGVEIFDFVAVFGGLD